MKTLFLPISLVSLSILCLFLDTAWAKRSFCRQLADGDLTIKAMGPSGNSFLIVTETKELFKLPLDNFDAQKLTMTTDYEPLSLNGSKFSFSSNPLWLTSKDSSLILLNSTDGQFYLIPFEDKGVSALKLTNLDASLNLTSTFLLSNSTGNSALLLSSRCLSESVIVSTSSKTTLFFNQPNYQIETKETHRQHSMFELTQVPTTGFIYKETLCLVTPTHLMWYQFNRSTNWQRFAISVPLREMFRCKSLHPNGLLWVFLIGTGSIIIMFTVAYLVDRWTL